MGSIKPIDDCLNLEKFEKYRQGRIEHYGQDKLRPNLTTIMLEQRGYDILKNIKRWIPELDTFRDEALKMFREQRNLSRWNNGRFEIIEQPLLNCRPLVPLAFHPIIIDIAYQYFECMPALGTMNLRRSLATGMPPDSTQLWHTDTNAPKLLKIFFYLNDVKKKDDGPFVYIEGSHKNKPEMESYKHRWNNNEILSIYDDDQIKYLCANYGDMIVANTRAFHRGHPPKNQDRYMLTLNYVCHPEKFDKGTRFKMRVQDFNELSKEQKAVADCLIKI